MLIGDISRRNARRYPSKVAVIDAGRRLTWAAVDERANRLATYLLGEGLGPGDRVAVCLRNTGEWPEITYGLAKAGLVLVPINIRLTPPEIRFIVEDAGCRAAIVHNDQAELGAEPFAGLAAIVEIKFSPPIWVHLVLWTPVIFGGAIVMLRPLKAGLITLQFRHDLLHHPPPAA